MKTHNVNRFLIAGLLLAVALTGANVAQAQTCSVSWATGKYGLWSTAGNWSTNQVPGPTDDVCIPSGTADASGVPSISIHSLQISQNAGVIFGSGTVSIATPVTVAGGLSISGTTLSVPSINVLAPPSVITGGDLGGYGTIEGSVTNSGFFSAVTAALTITGDYTQTSSGEIGATWPGFGLTPPYGLIQVEGNVTLSGSLSVRTDVPKFPPKSGSTFTVMTFDGSLSGEFTEVLPKPVTAKYEKDSVLAQYH